MSERPTTFLTSSQNFPCFHAVVASCPTPAPGIAKASVVRYKEHPLCIGSRPMIRRPILRVADPIVFDETTRKELQRQSRRRSVPVRVALRSRIILLAADGLQNLQIAAELNISVRRAALWRKRFLSLGKKSLLKDAPRPGRTASILASTFAQVIRKTTQTTPPHATHWSTRTMARSWTQAASRGELQNQPRSRVRRQAGRRGRPLLESARTCPGVVGR
jgi:transposase